MRTARWSRVPRTPSAGEIAHRRASAYPSGAFGPAVRSYLPEEARGLDEGSEAERQALRWLWSCADCRLSETGIPTREQATAALHRHRVRCPGTEPDWLRRARERYAAGLQVDFARPYPACGEDYDPGEAAIWRWEGRT